MTQGKIMASRKDTDLSWMCVLREMRCSPVNVRLEPATHELLYPASMKAWPWIERFE